MLIFHFLNNKSLFLNIHSNLFYLIPQAHSNGLFSSSHFPQYRDLRANKQAPTQ